MDQIQDTESTINNDMSIVDFQVQSSSVSQNNESIAQNDFDKPIVIEEKTNEKVIRTKYFTPLRLTYMALFTAISYILYLPTFEFPIFPAVPFLKIDFSNVFVLISGLTMGPLSAIIVGVLKELLHALTFSQTVGVGELANILLMLPYVLIPSFAYKKHKGIKAVIIMLICAVIAQTAFSVPINYLLTFPFYLGVYMDTPWLDGMAFYLDVWYWAVLFNLIKTVLLSVTVFLVYKPLSKLIKATNKRFSAKKTGNNTRENLNISNIIAKKDDALYNSTMEYVTCTQEQTMNLGVKLASRLSGGEVILLNGELGAGKTTFSKGIALGLGISETITSPTFTLMNSYESGRLKLYHFDMYRLPSGSDIDYGFEEYYGLADSVCLIEWTAAQEYYGAKVITVNIDYLSETERKITIEGI